MNMNSSHKLLLISIGSAILISGCALKPVTQNQPPQSSEPVACTMDAKVCPDGSAVGRVPPNCEFAPCPSPTTSAKTQKITVSGKITCLPNKSSNGMTSAECAFGLQTKDNKYYGLRLSDPNAVINMNDKTATVIGKLSQGTQSIYDIAGVIEVESIK